MDELVIGDKKYISSKRAAEMTGYAKDYVGQLCREGRVEARLVGRNWYVLASAMEDHRFGEPKEEKGTIREEEAPSLSKTWDTPRYEAERSPALPYINRLAESSFEPQERDGRAEAPVEAHSIETMQDAWKEWFNRDSIVAPTSEVGAPTESVGEETVSAEDQTNQEEASVLDEIENQPEHRLEEEVSIEIKPIIQSEEEIPDHVEEEPVPMRIREEVKERTRVAKRPHKSYFLTRASLFMLSVVVLAVAYLGSELANPVLIDKLHLNLISGVALFDRP